MKLIKRKIFDPTRTDDGYCRIKTNQEINDIFTYLLTYLLHGAGSFFRS